MSDTIVDLEFLYTAMLKGLMTDKHYAVTVINTFEKEFFEDNGMADVFECVQRHLNEFDALPTKDIIINSTPSEKQEDVINRFIASEQTEFEVSDNYDWLKNQTNLYLKDRAIKKAILDSVNIIDEGGNLNTIKTVVETALSKDIEINLGINYFDTMKDRLNRIFNASDNRIRTYYPSLDELYNGGFPPYTLNMMIAKVHGHKSGIMTNIISRQVLNGVNVAMASLEMSEDMYAQRFDANFTNLDINRIYHNPKVRNEFIKGIKNTRDDKNNGQLWIKEYPTGKATVGDFRRWLRELYIRGIKIDIFYCDYISLMKSENKNFGDLYKDGKSISEELRALGFEFNIPIVTVAQINRASTFLDFESLDMNSIGESFGITATADSMLVQGADPDDMMYKSELKWKCVKNRLGGRVGLTGKWFFDDKSLRIYDEIEFDKWVEDAKTSGGSRSIYEREIE